MKNTSAFIVALAGSATIFALSACSGSQSTTPSPTGVAASQSGSNFAQGNRLSDLARSGGSPKVQSLAHARAASHGIGSPRGPLDLFVSDASTDAVDVLANMHWKYQTNITNGIDGPDGSFYAKPDLYIADYLGVDVTEYSSPTTLAFTYNAGMIDPIDVTVDKHGNVFEADYNYSGGLAGFVNEYAQQTNTVSATCSPGGGVEGVVVDKHGDVFADYNTTASGTGLIVEYKGGLSGCHGTVLPVSLAFAGGMALDKQDNLLVCDQNAAKVDVIAPPYTSVTGSFGSGYTVPFHVTINAKNTQAYVADYSTGNVYVLSYPSGTNIATLGTANGITFAWAAVDTSNDVL